MYDLQFLFRGDSRYDKGALQPFLYTVNRYSAFMNTCPSSEDRRLREINPTMYIISLTWNIIGLM